MAQIDKRRSSRLKSALIDGRCGFSPKLEGIGPGCEKQCGACLLEIDAAGADGEFVAVLDRCQPLHFFHVSCIATWAELENSCPLCKNRFSKIGVYDAQGALLRVTHTEERDQAETAEAAEAEEDEDESVCYVCHQANNESALLLCDGSDGRCNAAAHYYCVNLACVPEGDWFCADCSGVHTSTSNLPDSLSKESSQESTVAPSADDSQNYFLKESSQESSSSSSLVGTSGMQANSAKPERPLDLEDVGNVREAEKFILSRSSTDPSKVKRHTSKVRVSTSSRPKSDADCDLTPVKREALETSTSSTDSKRFKWSKNKDATSVSNEAQVETNSTLKHEKLEPMNAMPSTTLSVATEDRPGTMAASDNASQKIPTWISRKGSRVTVDLGGRRIRDPAASVLAQAMKKALEQIQVSSPDISVSLQLAGNKLQKAGVASFLKALEQIGLPLARLDLERNRLDSLAGTWLAAWLSRQASGPPEEILLSLNSGLGDASVKALLESLSIKSRANNRLIPVWVEASFTGLKDVDGLLESLSEQVPFCFALDRSVCGPSKCSSCADDRRALLHLHGILEQCFNDEDGFGADRKSTLHFPHLAAPSTSKSSSAGQHRKMHDLHSPSKAISEGIQLSAATKWHLEEGQHVGKGPMRRVSRTPSSGFADSLQEPAAPSTAQPLPEAAEREKRQSWAASLGTRGGAEDESQDLLDATPNCGMWDLVRAEEKRRRLEKQKLRAAKSANATSRPSKQLSSESLGSSVRASR